MNPLSLTLSAFSIAAAITCALPSEKVQIVSRAHQIAGRVARDTRCPEFRFLDPLFVRPSLDQFAEILKFCAANRTNEYQENLFDCEDHVREFRVFASRWALKKFSGAPAGIAVGQAIVLIRGQVDGLGDYGDGGRHAMIVIVLDDGRTVLVEPRTSRWIFPISAVYEGVIEFVSVEF